MGDVRCADVLQWLRAAVLIEHRTPTPTIQAHVAGCATCQAALLLLANAVIDTPVPTIDCESCRANLPAFIEREDEDLARAIQAFPHVWWHLWTCAACAEIYQMVRVLVAAEQRGEIALPTVAAIATPRIPQLPIVVLRLKRQFLIRVLPAPLPQTSVMRGHGEGPIVLSRRKVVAGRTLLLSVEQQPNRDWLVGVVLTPPLEGWLVLTLGETVFRACFDAQGTAVVADVPTELLAGADGPDLTVGLEPTMEQ